MFNVSLKRLKIGEGSKTRPLRQGATTAYSNLCAGKVMVLFGNKQIKWVEILFYACTFNI